MLDYDQDLTWYVEGSYGYDLNKFVSCQFFKDIVDSFNSPSKSGSFHFSHSQLLMEFRTSLGLFNDSFTLTSDAFAKQEDLIENRKFRTSTMGQFASNLGLVLYDCPYSEPKIKFFHNEDPISVPACKNGGKYCTLPEFKRVFKFLIDCNYNEVCKNGPSKSDGMQLVAIVLFMLIVVAALQKRTPTILRCKFLIKTYKKY